MAGTILPIEVVAGVVSGQLFVTHAARVAVIGSAAQTLNGSLPTANHRTLTVQANAMWNPWPAVRLGVEYVFGQRTLDNDESGVMHRIHGSVRYSF